MKHEIELELERLRCRRRLDLEVWDDGRVCIRCPTAMRVLREEDLLEILRGIEDGSPWKEIWRTLFDFPEPPI